MLCCKLSFLCCHWEFVCCQLICSYSTINDSAVRRGTFYSNQITTFLNTIRATNLNYFFHLLCNILLYYKFSRWAHYGVCFDSCCQSKTCAEVGIFVLPSVEVVFWCCLEIKYWVGFLLSDIDTGAIHQNIYTRGVGSWTVLRSCQIFSLQSKSI